MGANDHRAEILDRAYRRGYALRRRRRWTTTVSALAVIAVVATGVASLTGGHDGRTVTVVQPSTPTTMPPAECTDTNRAVPAAEVPSDVSAWSGGAPVIGHGGIWTTLSATHVSGTLQEHAYLLKFPWFTRPNGPPLISARRLDGPGTFGSNVNQATDARGVWEVSSLSFSAAGCWEVTAHFQLSTVRFHLWIGPTPTRVAFEDQHDGTGLAVDCKVVADNDPICNLDILASRDAGRTWTHVSAIQNVRYAGWRGYPDIELAASGSNVWVYGTRTFESHDGARSFHEARFSGLVSALVPEGDTVWVASRACALCATETLLSAPAGGGPWTKIAGFPNLADPYADLVRPTPAVAYVVGRATHAVLYRTADGGRTWQPHALPQNPPDSNRTATVAIAALGTGQVWMLSGGAAPGRNQSKVLSRSEDGAGHWALVADTTGRPAVGQLPRAGLGLALTAVTAEEIWIPMNRGMFIGSADGGRHWFDTGVKTEVAQVTFVDPLHGWAWNGDASYRAIDGRTWTAVTP